MANHNENMTHLPRPIFRSYNRIGRHWIKRPRPQHIERNKDHNFEFTVASYNVLADQLLHEHPALYTHYSHEPWVYDWNYRKHNLLDEILYSNADILCLQEVQEEHYYDWFNPRLKDNGYTGIYKKRSGDKQDGCATFFKHDLFILEKYHLIDFNHNKIPLMDRNNVAILTFLKPRTKKINSLTSICVSNTHLLFNKKRGDIKLAQLAHLFAEINKFSETPSQNSNSNEHMPVILCGDFNSIPFSPIYRFLMTGKLRYKGLFKSAVSGQLEHPKGSIFGDEIFPQTLRLSNACKWTGDDDIENAKEELLIPNGVLQHDFELESSYKHFDVDGTPEVTTCHDHASTTVDYILYTSNGEESHINNATNPRNKLWLSGVLRLLSEYEVKKMGKLPNQVLSSDHLLLMSSFILS